jgi:hypothetical protein
VEQSLSDAAAAIASDIGVKDLRAADPTRYVGIVLFDGLTGREEEANEILGNIAPMLSFVGGSAGDGASSRRPASSRTASRRRTARCSY